jgi:hypothetical protein
MPRASGSPVQDIRAGASALDEDLQRVLKFEGASRVEDLGWTKPDLLRLLVPMTGVLKGVRDDYLLRLGFQCYRNHPPSAQFVNPDTLDYAYPRDQHHVPILNSPECQTHIAYPKPPGTIQVVCCSLTLEFYEVGHSVNPDHIWRTTDNFYSTVIAIRRAFASHYQGRHPRHGG